MRPHCGGSLRTVTTAANRLTALVVLGPVPSPYLTFERHVSTTMYIVLPVGVQIECICGNGVLRAASIVPRFKKAFPWSAPSSLTQDLCS